MCCERETQQQREHSPGLVQEAERVAYVLLDPLQWQNGDLSPLAFRKSDLSESRLSIYRADFCTAEQAYDHVVAPQLQRNPTRRLVGCLMAICAAIRALSDTGGNRTICVIDEGEPDFAAHAVLGFSTFVRSKSEQIAAQGNLSRLFQKGGQTQVLPGRA